MNTGGALVDVDGPLPGAVAGDGGFAGREKLVGVKAMRGGRRAPAR
jgi:hypothetical protein